MRSILKRFFRRAYIAVILLSVSCSQQRWVNGDIVYFGGDTIKGQILKNWKGLSIPEAGLIGFRRRSGNEDYTTSDPANVMESVRIGSAIYRKINFSWTLGDTIYMPDSCIRVKDTKIISWSHNFRFDENTTIQKATLRTVHAIFNDDYTYSCGFAHLLLSTTHYDLYETNFDKLRFFFSYGPNDGSPIELREFIVATPHNGCVPYYDYRNVFKTIYGILKDRHLLKKTNNTIEDDFMYSVDCAEFGKKSLIDLVKKLDRLSGGKVLHW